MPDAFNFLLCLKLWHNQPEPRINIKKHGIQFFSCLHNMPHNTPLPEKLLSYYTKPYMYVYWVTDHTYAFQISVPHIWLHLPKKHQDVSLVQRRTQGVVPFDLR